MLRNEPDRVRPALGHVRTAADTVLEELKSVISVLRDPDEVRSSRLIHHVQPPRTDVPEQH